MSIDDHIKNAVFSHTKTTKLLQDYVLFGEKSPEIIEKIGLTNNCDFGVWLESTETLPFRQKTNFEELKTLHTIYHNEVKRIAACIHNNDLNLARLLIRDKDYQQTLSQFIEVLFNFLDQVRKDEQYKNSKQR
jgi:hypothetical protein